MSPQSTGCVPDANKEYQNMDQVRDEEDQVESEDEDDMFSELAFTLDDARTHDTVFLNQKFPDLHRTVKALTLRKYQRQDFYCTLCERNDFGSIDDLIDHIMPTHSSSPTTVMNTGFFVCTLCYEKKQRDLASTPPPYCFLEAFDLALHVFKFHKALAEGTRMKILLKMSARVELVTMHRTYNDEHGDDGIWEYLACTDDDVVMYPAANRVEEALVTTSQSELPVADASETRLGEKPKRGRPKGSKTKTRRLARLTLTKEMANIPIKVAGQDSSDDGESGNLIIDEAGSAWDIDIEEPASIESGRSSCSDRENNIIDLNETPLWVSDNPIVAPSQRQVQPPSFYDNGKGTDRDLIHHGRAIPTPAYRLKMKKKREELALAKKMIADIKAAEMAAASGIQRLHQEEQQQPQQQQRHSVITPQMQQWDFGQYHGTMTVQCPNSSSVGMDSGMQKRGPPAASNPSSSLSPPPPSLPAAGMRGERVTPPPKPEVPTDEDSPPMKVKKLPHKKGDIKKRRAQIEELRRKRIAGRAKRLNCILHEDSEDPEALKKISMHKLLFMTTREVKKLRTKEDILLECKQVLVQKKAALQKRLVEAQMLERSRTGLQRRLALR